MACVPVGLYGHPGVGDGVRHLSGWTTIGLLRGGPEFVQKWRQRTALLHSGHRCLLPLELNQDWALAAQFRFGLRAEQHLMLLAARAAGTSCLVLIAGGFGLGSSL